MILRQHGRLEVTKRKRRGRFLDNYYRLVVFIIITFVNLPAMARIQGSAHDFNSYGWSGSEVCDMCHIPDNDDALNKPPPLWNHAISSASYAVFRHPSLPPTNQITATENMSRLCLSCHDGTIAPDKFGGNRDAHSKTVRQSLDISLRNHHPINVQQFFDAGGAVGMALAGVKLFAGMVECASCHDVHNDEVADEKLLRVARAGSKLCFQCHQK